MCLFLEFLSFRSLATPIEDAPVLISLFQMKETISSYRPQIRVKGGDAYHFGC